VEGERGIVTHGADGTEQQGEGDRGRLAQE